MTNEELQKKIEMLRGQGNQVDIGGVLADVLKDLAPKYAKGYPWIPPQVGKVDKEDLIGRLAETEEELNKLFEKGTTGLIYDTFFGEEYGSARTIDIVERTESKDDEQSSVSVAFAVLKMTGKTGVSGIVRYFRAIETETGNEEYYVEYAPDTLYN